MIWPGGVTNSEWQAEDAVSEYRLLMPARALRDQGADIDLLRGGPTIVWDRSWAGRPEPPADAKILHVERPDGDVLVLQRPNRKWHVAIVESLRRQGMRVVIDIDDRLDKVPVDNQAHAAYDPSWRSHAHHGWVKAACAAADMVTVSVPTLVEPFGFGHARVLSNLVPQSYLELNSVKVLHSVGWSGNIGVHPHDLQVTSGMVGEALSRHDSWKFHVVGTGNGVREVLGLPIDPVASGWVDFGVYPNVLGRLQVGIVPLDRSIFSAAKSALKASEMASLGVAVVMSPTPDNVALHEAGVGLLAKSPKDWLRHLDRLMGDDIFREEVVERGRTVMAQRTYEERSHLWHDAWMGLGPPHHRSTKSTKRKKAGARR